MQGLLRQVAKFATIGAGATALHVASALLFNSGFGFSALQANFLAFLVASAFTFVGNFFWTFARSGTFTSTIPRFVVLSSGCFVVNQAIVYGVTSVMHMPLWVAMVPVVAVIPAFSFWASKTKVFVSQASSR
jgi:putative flippase GtrA